jgi:DNA-binding MarR family transcriptional regulator
MNETESVGLLIKKIHDATGAIANTELKELNLTTSQSQLLYFLYQMKKQTVSLREIEKHFCIKHTTAIGIVNRLESKGFIKSSGSHDDKRVRIIEITREGEKIHEAISSKLLSLEEKYLKGLTPEDTDRLKRSLTIINGNLQKLK